MKSDTKLPPIDFKEDIEKYEAKAETTEIALVKCSHKSATIIHDELRCPCGAVWRGPRLHELYTLFTQ